MGKMLGLYLYHFESMDTEKLGQWVKDLEEILDTTMGKWECAQSSTVGTREKTRYGGRGEEWVKSCDGFKDNDLKVKDMILDRAKAILRALANDPFLGLREDNGYWRCDYCGKVLFKCGELFGENSWHVGHHAGCRVWDAHFFLANPGVGD